jgi:hypothetical protein
MTRKPITHADQPDTKTPLVVVALAGVFVGAVLCLAVVALFMAVSSLLN